MKVLLVNTFYAPVRFGGVERMVQSLAEHLLPLGHDVAVVTIAMDGRAGSRTVQGVRVHDVPLRNVYQLLPLDKRRAALKPLWHAIDSANPRMARLFADVLADEAPDVVHTHNLTGFSTLVWRTAAARRIPVVHTLHDYYLLCLRSTMYHGGRPRVGQHLPCAPFSRVRLRPARTVSAVVGVSRSVLDAHDRARAFSRAASRSVIANPAVVRGDGRPRVPGAGLRIGYLGRLEPIKGVHVLLQAVRRLPPGPWSLSVAGRGSPVYTAELRRLAAELPIAFSGEVDVPDFLGETDVLVVPSLAPETFGMVVVEAFSCGVPVVVSDRGGLPELVDEGRTGFVVPAGRAESLQATLERLIAAPGIVTGMQHACHAAAERFAPARIARQYSELYVAQSSRSAATAAGT